MERQSPNGIGCQGEIAALQEASESVLLFALPACVTPDACAGTTAKHLWLLILARLFCGSPFSAPVDPPWSGLDFELWTYVPVYNRPRNSVLMFKGKDES
ncbi:hypothetical protein MRX96_025847 [Rhipicephalus microplus]